MFAELPKHLLEALKLAPRYLIALSLVLGITLFAPDEWTQKLGISHLAEDYRQVIGLSFLLSLALLLVYAGQWVAKKIGRALYERKFKRDLAKRLRRLTEDEKQILRYYIAKQTRANTLRYEDGVVQGLVGSGVIFRTSNMGSLLEGFAFNINEFAWDMLNEDPSLLVGETDTYRTDKRHYW